MTAIFTRRGFLAATAPFATVTVAAAVPVSTAAQASRVFETFAVRLAEAEETYRNAAVEHAQALDRLFAMAPTKAPDALLIGPRPVAGEYLCGELELTADNKVVVPNRRISTVNYLKVETQDHRAKTKMGREVRRRLPIAQAYETAMELAREASGYNAAETARYWAALVLMGLAKEAFAMPAETMADVGIKARAFLAGGHSDDSAPLQLGVRHGQALAADVARFAGGVS